MSTTWHLVAPGETKGRMGEESTAAVVAAVDGGAIRAVPEGGCFRARNLFLRVPGRCYVNCRRGRERGVGMQNNLQRSMR